MKKKNRYVLGKKFVCILLSLVLVGACFVSSATASSISYTYMSGTRDPFKRPFSSTSIWNMPIGSDAQYVPAGFTDDGVTKYGEAQRHHMSVDVEYIYDTDYDDEYLDVYSTVSGYGRWPDSTEGLRSKSGTIYWPTGVTIPVSTGNCCTAILQPDRSTVIQIQPTCRVDADSTYVTGNPGDSVDIYGDGLKGGSHWGSGLSTIGGSIRVGELTSDEPIRHALKLNVPAYEFLYYGDDVKGYMWPADRCDSYANRSDSLLKYGGTDPRLVMGTLLALPTDLTVEDLGLTTDVAKKLFFTLQNYGCYISDDSAYNGYSLCVEDGVVDEVQSKYGIKMQNAYPSVSGISGEYRADMIKIITNLCTIVNNGPDSIGGGGTPRQSLLPELVKSSSISVPDTNMTVFAGASKKIDTTFSVANVSDKTLYYVSKNTDVATVDNNGVVTAHKKGVADIMVSRAVGGSFVWVTAFVGCGDLNLNGLVDAGDYSILKGNVVGFIDIPDADIGTGDINTSGAIDSNDALLMKQALISLADAKTTFFPVIAK